MVLSFVTVDFHKTTLVLEFIFASNISVLVIVILFIVRYNINYVDFYDKRQYYRQRLIY